MIDLEFIERLIRTLDESGLDHVEIERGGTRVRISKSPPIRSEEAGEAHAALADEASGSAPAAEMAPVPPSGQTGGEQGPGEELLEITCPMVGTFYRAPSPGAEPFVDVGSEIAPGDVLCIIEAMKLMNELEAEVSGVILQICVGDGEPVEFGQVLFRVRPS